MSADAGRASAPHPTGEKTPPLQAGQQLGTQRLPRRLGLWSAAAVMVGSTIGSGIFRVPSTVAAELGTVGGIALVWVTGGAIALFGALTLVELAVLFPRSGGIYVHLREAYGPLPAFLFGWTELLVIRPSALGAIAMIFAGYLKTFVTLSDAAVRLVAAGAILLLAAANFRSVTWGAAVQNASTLAKLAALVALSSAAFVIAEPGAGAFAAAPQSTPVSSAGFGLALVAVLWTYDGWADLTLIAGEVKDPERTLPRALLGGVGVVVAVYLLVNAAYLYVLPLQEIAASSLVAADAAQRIAGSAGASLLAALVMLSTFGALNGSMMTAPRIFYAMAEDGLFFRPIAAVHPRYRTPAAAIGLTALLGLAYVSVRSFEQLADAFVLGIWPFYALAVGAVFRLRRRRPQLARPYRTPGYPLVPLVFLLASIAMLLNALRERPGSTLFGFAVILLGIPVFYAWRALRGVSQPEDGEA